jgi:hypothetical protein
VTRRIEPGAIRASRFLAVEFTACISAVESKRRKGTSAPQALRHMSAPTVIRKEMAASEGESRRNLQDGHEVP